MDYILAKKLKDAGFPQRDNRIALYPSGYVLRGAKKGIEESRVVRAYPPTLSELIEACGNDFGELANYGNGKYGACVYSFADENHKEWIDGKTPEEAVANLWLSLSAVSAPQITNN